MRTSILAGLPLALLALLAASDARADTKVGVTAAVNPQAIGQPPTEPERVLMVGTDNFQNEKITTGPAGQLQLLFVDGSSLAIGPDAAVTIDEYVYNPNTKTGKLAISATQGLMKLVGGAISKSSEVTVTTPTMTAGIRGGIATIDSRPNQPARAQFLFGNSLRVTSAGVTQVATRPGFQILVPAGQPPLSPTRMTAADAQASQGQFQGRARPAPAGQQGGEKSEDSALGQSNVSGATGSNKQPSTLSQAGAIETIGGFNQTLNPNTSTQINQVQSGSTDQITRGAAGVAANSFAPEGGSLGLTLYGRFYSDQLFSSFNPQNGTATLNTANNGPITFKVDGSGNNRTVTFTLPTGNGTFQDFTLPFNLGANYSTGSLAIRNGGGSASGSVQVDPDGIFFSVFGRFTPGAGQSCSNGNSDCKFAIFGGVPTPSLPTSGFSTYDVQPPFADNNYPFVNRNNLPPGNISPLYVAWSPVTNPSLAAGNGQRATFMQASIFINGSGSSQSSGLFGVTGAFFKESNSTVGAAGGMVGQIRDCASCLSTRFGSGVASAQIVTGSGLGNAIYGSNAKYIVFVPDQITPAPGQEDTRSTGAVSEVPFGTSTTNQTTNDAGFFINVARSQGVVSATSAGRNTQQMQGYVGGIMDNRNANGQFLPSAFGTPFGNGPTSGVSTDASTNRMAANFAFRNFDNTTISYNLLLGNPANSLGARGTFINDLIFAAREAVDTSNNPMSTFTNTAAGTGGTVSFSRLFMLPNSVAGVNLSSFAGSVNQCTCTFLQWGWWIGEVSAANTPLARFQLATWVAGVLPPTASIQALGNVTANYNGHLVGNVAVGGGAGGGGFTYVAAGNFSSQWTFNNGSSGSGTFTVTGWDRAQFGPSGATLTGGGSASNFRDFNGSVSGSGLSGAIGGSFFRSPSDVAAYMGGNFHIIGTNYKAAGIIAAQR